MCFLREFIFLNQCNQRVTPSKCDGFALDTILTWPEASMTTHQPVPAKVMFILYMMPINLSLECEILCQNRKYRMKCANGVSVRTDMCLMYHK